MLAFYAEAIERAKAYAKQRAVGLVEQLGAGLDGIVFATGSQTAIKALRYEELYAREKAIYARLSELHVEQVEGFNVPRVLDFEDSLWVIEMEVVRPPYVLDFAGAYLDEEPPYVDSEEIMAQWESEKREQFEDRWPTVQRVLARFKQHGIYLADIKPGNITFAE